MQHKQSAHQTARANMINQLGFNSNSISWFCEIAKTNAIHVLSRNSVTSPVQESFSSINANVRSGQIVTILFPITFLYFSSLAMSHPSLFSTVFLSSPIMSGYSPYCWRLFWCLLDQSNPLCFFSCLHSQDYVQTNFFQHTENRHLTKYSQNCLFQSWFKYSIAFLRNLLMHL